VFPPEVEPLLAPPEAVPPGAAPPVVLVDPLAPPLALVPACEVDPAVPPVFGSFSEPHAITLVKQATSDGNTQLEVGKRSSMEAS
jgi:hypothetical protein